MLGYSRLITIFESFHLITGIGIQSCLCLYYDTVEPQPIAITNDTRKAEFYCLCYT